ncbi:MAG: hypothetical protein ACOCZ8_01840, partial [Bacteroidota bacterium]
SVSASWTVDTTAPNLLSFTGTPSGLINTVDDGFDIVFDEPIDPASFTRAEIRLTRDGGANLVNANLLINRITPTTYRISGLSSLTAAELRAREARLNMSSTDAHAAIELQQAEEDLNYAGLKQLDTSLCRRRAETLLENAYQRRLEAIQRPSDKLQMPGSKMPEYA